MIESLTLVQYITLYAPLLSLILISNTLVPIDLKGLPFFGFSPDCNLIRSVPATFFAAIGKSAISALLVPVYAICFNVFTKTSVYNYVHPGKRKCICFYTFWRFISTEFSRNGPPREIRTPDTQVRSLVLYPAELWADRTRSICVLGVRFQLQEAC